MKNIKKEQTTYPLPLRERKEFQDDERVLEIQVRGEKENIQRGSKKDPSPVPVIFAALKNSHSLSRKGRGQKVAFTLAEVLITLGVIGVVAAITLPSFIQNHQAKVRNEQNRMVQYKLTKATDQMKSLGLIGNYTTTKDFVNELKKHFKIVQVCENDNLEQCWPTKVIAADGTEVKVSDIKNGKSMNPNGWTKETLGIVTADGTPMIITYKDDCPALEAEKTYTWQTEDNKPVTNATTSCIAAIYDINGKSRPNKSGVDVRLFHVTNLNDKPATNCDSGVCIMTNDMPFTPMDVSTQEYKDYVAKNNLWECTDSICKSNGDYWVGAMKACDDAGMSLPTLDQLAQIANYIYDTNMCGAKTYCSGLTVNKTHNQNVGNIIPDSGYTSLWSNMRSGSNGANYRTFDPASSSCGGDGPSRDYSAAIARCVTK